jgi:hypothetical protein
MSRNDLEAIELTDDEQRFLKWGMAAWHGACHPPLLMRQALGFREYADIFPWTDEKLHSIGPVTEMSRADWTKLMTLAEIGFASDTIGAGREWSVVSGMPDREALPLMRAIQAKLRHVMLRYDQQTGDPLPGSE